MASNLVSLHILATPVKPVQTSFWLQDCDFQDDPLVPSQTQAFVGEVVYLLVFCPGVRVINCGCLVRLHILGWRAANPVSATSFSFTKAKRFEE